MNINLMNVIKSLKVTQQDIIIEIALASNPKHLNFNREKTEELLKDLENWGNRTADRYLTELEENKNFNNVYNFFEYFFELCKETNKHRLISWKYDFERCYRDNDYNNCRLLIARLKRLEFFYLTTVNRELAIIKALSLGFPCLEDTFGVTPELIEEIRKQQKQDKQSNDISELEIIKQWVAKINEIKFTKHNSKETPKNLAVILSCGLEAFMAKKNNPKITKQQIIYNLKDKYGKNNRTIERYIQQINELETELNLPPISQYIKQK